MHFGSGFPARKHFTATFSCSNAYSSDDKVNVNANFRHLIRYIILHLGPKSIERGGWGDEDSTKISLYTYFLVLL